MAKAKQVTVTNQTQGEIVLQAPAEEVKNDKTVNRQFKQKKIKFVRTERDRTQQEHESGEVVLFGKPKHDHMGYPVTMKKKDWEALKENNGALQAMEDNRKILVV